jgi:hypothetical protein
MGDLMIEQWVKDLVEESLGPSHMKIGEIIKHPDGGSVKVLGGQYWGERGLSNFWTWQEVLPDGTLGKIRHGYGW